MKNEKTKKRKHTRRIAKKITSYPRDKILENSVVSLQVAEVKVATTKCNRCTKCCLKLSGGRAVYISMSTDVMPIRAALSLGPFSLILS